MFPRLLIESFRRQRRRKLLAALAILLGTTAVTAMLAIGTSVGDRINRQLSAYGANIVVYPSADTLEVRVGGVDIRPAAAGAYLQEADLTRIKTIFWANSVEDISPELPVNVNAQPVGAATQSLPAVGYWFRHSMKVGTDSWTMGAPQMHPWWKLRGTWPRDGALDQVAVGSALAEGLHLQPGSTLTLNGRAAQVTGIVTAGDATDRTVLAPLALAQQWSGHPGAVRRVLVSALTKPEDALARKNPATLSPKLRDRWYCSPYANSIAYQIQEAIPHSRAEQIRRIAQGEGTVLSRISGLMWLIAVASLAAAGLAVSASMMTSVVERRQEIGLMRALGATGATIASLFFSEAAMLAIGGGLLGFAGGSLLARRIGVEVFGSAIPVEPVILPLTLLLATVVAVAGTAPSLWRAVRVEPATVLREDA
jgi:putative ABC transport system permease protein